MAKFKLTLRNSLTMVLAFFGSLLSPNVFSQEAEEAADATPKSAGDAAKEQATGSLSAGAIAAAVAAATNTNTSTQTLARYVTNTNTTTSTATNTSTNTSTTTNTATTTLGNDADSDGFLQTSEIDPTGSDELFIDELDNQTANFEQEIEQTIEFVQGDPSLAYVEYTPEGEIIETYGEAEFTQDIVQEIPVFREDG